MRTHAGQTCGVSRFTIIAGLTSVVSVSTLTQPIEQVLGVCAAEPPLLRAHRTAPEYAFIIVAYARHASRRIH